MKSTTQCAVTQFKDLTHLAISDHIEVFGFVFLITLVLVPVRASVTFAVCTWENRWTNVQYGKVVSILLGKA